MSNEEKIARITDYIALNYMSGTSGRGYWETGNFDDAFEMGKRVGERDALYEIAVLLGLEVEEPAELEYDY